MKNQRPDCYSLPMTPFDFSQICSAPNVEAATHRVFDEAYDKWLNGGATALTIGELTVYCVETTFGEICNGGIEQYLTNESGQLAQSCPDALECVGLLEYAQIMREAIRRCDCVTLEDETDDDDPRSPWIEWTPKESVQDDPFEDLDKRFFELYFSDKTEFRRKLFQYITEHESDFLTPDS